LEGGVESEELKHQFSQVEEDLDLYENPKPIPIPNKGTPRKKMIVMKDKDEVEKVERRSIVCSKSLKRKIKNKNPKANLILSHVNHTFLILNFQIGPQAFQHTHCTIEKNVFINVRKREKKIYKNFIFGF
jgi:hypothetical protein